MIGDLFFFCIIANALQLSETIMSDDCDNLLNDPLHSMAFMHMFMYGDDDDGRLELHKGNYYANHEAM